MKNGYVKRIVCMLLIGCCTLAAACRGREKEADEDETVMHLWVGVYDAGGGTEWLKKVADRFEKEYAGYDFRNGRTGVRIHIDPSRDYSSETMDQNIDKLNGEVIFAEGAPAVYMSNSGYLLDIHDVATGDIGDNFITKAKGGEGHSIADLLDERQKTFLLATENGHYYTLPTNEFYFSLIYDKDLFREENLYFNTSGNLICDDEGNARLSAGPDGDLASAYDNGLPATYDEFFLLCDKIVDLGMQPLTWGGTVNDYISSFLLCMAADYHGEEQTRLNYDYKGEMKDYIVGFSGKTPLFNAENKKINVDNGYELYKQSGRYYALKFLERLLKTSTVKDGKSTEKYVEKSEIYSTAFTHTAAQTRFVSSKDSKTKKRVAMLIDGTWWQNEAKNTLIDAEGSETAARKRNFGVMPMPKVDEERLGEQTLLMLTGQSAMIKKSIEEAKIPLAKEFLKYCFTQESLVEYLQTTSMARPYRFELTEEEYGGLTSWGKNLYDLHRDAKKVYQDSSSEIAKYYSSALWYSKNLWNATIDGEGYTFPSTALKYGSLVTAESYFLGMQNYWTRDAWRSKFSYVVTPE